jgi:transcription elongation GreA/GreB family factor
MNATSVATKRTKSEARYSQRANVGTVNIEQTREILGTVLNRLGAMLVERLQQARSESPDVLETDVSMQHLRHAIRRLGAITTGLDVVDGASIPASGAGYGSEVKVRNLDAGHVQTYRLLVGSLMDLDENHVSLASPVGQALIGSMPGDVITIAAPRQQVRLKVLTVQTLTQLLESVSAEFLDE